MVLLLGTLLVLLLYLNFITSIYVHFQAKSICLWINEGKGEDPAVGPSAFEHLTWLREQGIRNCLCEVVEPNRDFYESDVKTILVSKSGNEKIRLNYTLSFSGRNFMQPFYFQHQTESNHVHSSEGWNYKK